MSVIISFYFLFAVIRRIKLHIHRVPKKHVTTFSTITLTTGVQLQ